MTNEAHGLDFVTNVSVSNASGSQMMMSNRTADEIEDWGFLVKQSVGHLVVLVGLIGNCLSFIVMKSKPLRNKSYSHYLCALAVFDSTVLITREFRHVDDLLTYLGEPGVFTHFSTAACRIFAFTETVASLVSSWLVVAMAMERLVVVYRPFRKNVLCTQKGAIVVITTIFVILSYSQVYRFIITEATPDGCLAQTAFQDVYLVLHVYVYQIMLAFLLPVIIVFICNIFVLKKICLMDRTLREDENSASTRLNDASHHRNKTTRLLLAVSFVFIATLLPSNVFSMVLLINIKVRGMGARDLIIAAVPWNSTLSVISDINYAANFYIYVLSGQKFRKELGRMLRTNRFRFASMSATSTRATREEFVMS